MSDRLADPFNNSPAVSELQSRYEALAHERNLLARQLSNVPRTSRDLAEQVVKLEQTAVSIRQARDLLLTRNHELIAELARAEDRISELTFERDEARGARDTARARSDSNTGELEALRMRVSELEAQSLEAEVRLAAERAEKIETITNLTQELSAAQALAKEQAGNPYTLSESTRDLSPPPVASEPETTLLAERYSASEQARQEAVESEAKACAERDRTLAELETLRAELISTRSGLESHIASLRSHLAAYETAAAHWTEEPPKLSVVMPIEEKPAPLPEESYQPATVAPTPSSTPAQGLVSVPTVKLMYGCLKSLTKNPEVLDALGNHLRAFSDLAHSSGFGAAHRYAVTCRELTRWLRQTPGKVNGAIPALEEAIQLLDQLYRRGPEQIPDPAGALVYTVDDDIDNCECVTFALEKMTLVSKYAIKPLVALNDLQVASCVLIILDVNMPGMDGFELCKHIRKIERHQHTPILFASALTSTGERLAGPEAAEFGRIQFIPKPYNLAEFSLKAMGMIVRQYL